MKNKGLIVGLLLAVTASLLILDGCSKVHAQTDASAATPGAPPEPKVVPFPDAALFSVDHPEQFPLATAAEHPTTSELVVTGTVMRLSTPSTFTTREIVPACEPCSPRKPSIGIS